MWKDITVGFVVSFIGIQQERHFRVQSESHTDEPAVGLAGLVIVVRAKVRGRLG